MHRALHCLSTGSAISPAVKGEPRLFCEIFSTKNFFLAQKFERANIFEQVCVYG